MPQCLKSMFFEFFSNGGAQKRPRMKKYQKMFYQEKASSKIHGNLRKFCRNNCFIISVILWIPLWEEFISKTTETCNLSYLVFSTKKIHQIFMDFWRCFYLVKLGGLDFRLWTNRAMIHTHIIYCTIFLFHFFK